MFNRWSESRSYRLHGACAMVWVLETATGGFLKKPDRILVKIKPGHTCVFLQVVKGLKYFKYGQ